VDNPLEKAVTVLRQWAPELRDRYIWNSPTEKDLAEAVRKNILTEAQCAHLGGEKDRFKRNVVLKDMLSENLFRAYDDPVHFFTCRWIIRNWGGIRGGMASDEREDAKKLLEGARDFENALQSGKPAGLNRIASWSKYMAFKYPEKYVIYDARVSYTINALLFLTGSTSGFFPAVESRNTVMNAFDIYTLIRLRSASRYRELGQKKNGKRLASFDTHIFRDPKNAYTDLCRFVCDCTPKVWSAYPERQKYPFFTEMLLFSVADSLVIEQIFTSCAISVNV
jgi:hypothetical protein